MEVTIESEEFEYKNLLAILVATVNSTGLKHVYNNYKSKPYNVMYVCSLYLARQV